LGLARLHVIGVNPNVNCVVEDSQVVEPGDAVGCEDDGESDGRAEAGDLEGEDVVGLVDVGLDVGLDVVGVLEGWAEVGEAVGDGQSLTTVRLRPLLLLQLTQLQKFVWNRKPNACPEGMARVACTLCSGVEIMYDAEPETPASEASTVVVVWSTTCSSLVNVPEP